MKKIILFISLILFLTIISCSPPPNGPIMPSKPAGIVIVDK